MSLTTLSLVPTVPGGEPHGVLGVHVGNVCYAVDGGGQEETRAGSKAQSPGGPGPRGASQERLPSGHTCPSPAMHFCPPDLPLPAFLSLPATLIILCGQICVLEGRESRAVWAQGLPGKNGIFTDELSPRPLGQGNI